MAGFSFDTSSVAPRESNYELLPAGWYPAQVVESAVVALKSGNGQAIKLTIEILADGYRGRKVWANLNVRHTNPTAEQIAQQQLRELCDSIGLARFTDTTELHNKPFQARVKIRKDTTGQYEDQNEVAGFKSVGGATSPHGQAVPAGVPPRAAPAANAAAAGASAPPWAKKSA
jgi:hypothetical protein